MIRRRKPRARVPLSRKPDPQQPAQETFDWLPEREIVEGVRRKANLASDVLARCAALYGTSAPDEASE
jgi:hypothetical protein